MIMRRFFMTYKVCDACGRKIKHGEIILRAEDGGKCYCFGCEGRKYIDSLSEDEESIYKPYLVQHGIACQIIMDRDEFSGLEDGMHVMIYDNYKKTAFAYEKSRSAIETVADFAKNILGYFVVEKKGDFSCVFFAEGFVCNTKKFITRSDDASVFIKQFCVWTGKQESDIFLLINEHDDVVGLMNGGVAEESLIVKEYFAGRITTKSIDETVEECKAATEAEVYTQKKEEDAKKKEEDAKKKTRDGIKKKINSAIARDVDEALKDLTPQKLLDYCENRICGQGINLKQAVYFVYSYLQSVASDEPFQAENWILTSPSGTGKTEFYRAVRDIFKEYNIPIPVAQIDLSQITEAGYKGSNTNTITDRLAAMNPAMGGYAICFLDEADKKCVPSVSSRGVDNNAAVQSNLLTMLEGINLTADVGEKEVPFDTSKTMFVLLGSFQQLRDEKQEKSLAKGRIGFGDDYGDRDEKTVSEDAMYEDLDIEDMIKFGMQEELAGRITYVINFHKLSEDDMRKLIRKKVQEISDTLKVNIYITDEAVEDFLKISFGNLGVRAPMNRIKKLVQERIAEVFFESGFDAERQRVVIESDNMAYVEDASDTAKEYYDRHNAYKRKVEIE